MGGKLFGDKTNFGLNPLSNNNNKKVNNNTVKKPKISIMLECDDFDFTSQSNKSSQQIFSSALFS